MKTILLLIVFLVVGVWIGTHWSSNTDTNEASMKTATTTLVATSSIESREELARNSVSSTTESDDNPSIDLTQTQAKPIIVDSAVLSDGQNQLLETFGIDTENIEITAEMIQCAKEAVGQERMDEIVDGNTPTFLEGLALFTCYQ